MTNFEKVKEYYKEFNENERLSNDNSGRLEFEMTMRNLKRYLPENATILDLGGATGAYSFPLAQNGYKMYLADLSEKLIEQAKEKIQKENITNIVSCDIVNAIDLSIYEDKEFKIDF
jgi:S-adenosylmethionine-dependent methyltransferase